MMWRNRKKDIVMHKKKRRSGKIGFTVIEFLLAIVLFTVVSTSLYLSMRSGLVLYQRSTEGLALSHEVAHFLNTLQYDLRNAVQYSPVLFEGSEDSITFPAVLVKYKKGKEITDLYTVTYSFSSGKLKRSYQSISNKKFKKKENKLFGDVLKKVSFSFGFKDDDASEITWENKWDVADEGTLPCAVKVNVVVTFSDAEQKRSEDKKIERKIWIPHGAWGSEDG